MGSLLLKMILILKTNSIKNILFGVLIHTIIGKNIKEKNKL